jgi:NTE family protein
MTVPDFTGEVADLVVQARSEFAGKPFSDILDAAGNQYVDLVMGGGGVLGIALVGYTYVLEEVGIRFLRVGGTSAGSINALGLAALGPPAEKKSDRLLAELADLDVWSFVDGSWAAKSLIRDFLAGRSTLRKAMDVVLEYRSFAARLGINPGRVFRDWLAGVIRKAGITTSRELRERMRTVPAGLHFRDGRPVTVDDADAHLGVVATDITTETKAVFPLMASLYWPDPDGLNPADFVRASMSIPFFFEPLRATAVPQGPAAEAAWRQMIHNDRFPPPECAFVDGGVLSNFPIDLFHETGQTPTAPTFGVKLGADAQPVPHFDRLVQLTMAVFNAARHALDNDFIARNPDFRQLVCVVDTSTQNWLNFDLTPDDKVELFQRGAEAAVQFLRHFDWPQYQALRTAQIESHTVPAPLSPSLTPAGPAGPG